MAAISYKDLVAAGAPELPGKLFYRVKLDNDVPAHVRVEIRAPRLLGSQMIAVRSARVQADVDPLAQAAQVATTAANAVNVGLGFHAVLGDYRKGAA
jgi:hypothetical protein